MTHAWAHAFIEHTDPVVGSEVKQAPTEVRLWYTQGLEPAFSRVQVFDAAGKETRQKRRSPGSGEQPSHDRVSPGWPGSGHLQGGLARGQRGHTPYGRKLQVPGGTLENFLLWTPCRSCGRSGSAGACRRPPPLLLVGTGSPYACSLLARVWTRPLGGRACLGQAGRRWSSRACSLLGLTAAEMSGEPLAQAPHKRQCCAGARQHALWKRCGAGGWACSRDGSPVQLGRQQPPTV